MIAAIMFSYQELFNISSQLIQYRCKVHNPFKTLPKFWEGRKFLKLHRLNTKLVFLAFLVAA